MTTLPFATDDVTRVVDLFPADPWYFAGLDVDLRSLAADMIHCMAKDGYPVSEVSPVSFRREYGTDMFLELIENNLFAPEDDHDEVVGDIRATGTGVSLTTPHGLWEMSDEMTLSVMQGLVTAMQFRLTRPFSAEDDSSILSRGRELRRPAGQTAQISTVHDFYA